MHACDVEPVPQVSLQLYNIIDTIIISHPGIGNGLISTGTPRRMRIGKISLVAMVTCTAAGN